MTNTRETRVDISALSTPNYLDEGGSFTKTSQPLIQERVSQQASTMSGADRSGKRNLHSDAPESHKIKCLDHVTQ